MTTSLPVIDVQDFPAQSGKLVAACEAWACFRIINHGIPTALMSDMHTVGTALFERPMEIKRRTTNPNIPDRGYVANDGGSSSTVLTPSAPLPSPHQQRETKQREFLYESLGLYDPASPGAIDAFCDQLELFPKQRETIMRYINATHGLAMSIGYKLAESMGLVESDLFKGWACQYRLNKYNFNPQTLGRTGVPIHTDSGFLTIVQDDGGPKEAAVEAPEEIVDSDDPNSRQRLYVPFTFEQYRMLRNSTRSKAGEALHLLRTTNEY
ncbi:hypothetical protein RHGRI_025706 [Rhododendron griersonianum]|uniref:Non-haem dioxygenase N-terminal domain-containing protein n=1 Tax=Rhododendron griersonianum TaxID=479676 RepID=A0AAV6ITJ3_9ERIC|nr:hypothetical protein RHGRI_025706 [Rhododendron griersonianum]